MLARTFGQKAPRIARPSRSLNDRIQERWDRRTFE